MVYDLIIIGGGPAGLAAAIYAARKKLNFKVLAQRIGGEQILAAGKIENYPGIKLVPSGREFINKLVEQVKEYNVEIEEGQEVVKIEKKNDNFLIKTKRGSEYQAKAIIVASGKKPRKLGVPGEKEFEGKGISYCSHCDAPLFKDKVVAVIGGGNAGLDSAMDLTKYAKKIYLLELGPRIIGDPATQEKLKETGKVEFIVMAQTKEIKGEKPTPYRPAPSERGGAGAEFVTSLIYEDRNTKEEKELLVQGVFIHVGAVTSVDFAKDFLELNSSNEIVIDHKTNQTSVEGIFAAGDVTDVKWKQIVVACGEGVKALLSAYDYLQRK